jgi:hypothetical protein
MDIKRHAHIRLSEDHSRKVLEVGVPPGATLQASLKIVARLDNVIEKLTGCPCLSGLDIRFRNHVEELIEFG